MSNIRKDMKYIWETVPGSKMVDWLEKLWIAGHSDDIDLSKWFGFVERGQVNFDEEEYYDDWLYTDWFDEELDELEE